MQIDAQLVIFSLEQTLIALQPIFVVIWVLVHIVH